MPGPGLVSEKRNKEAEGKRLTNARQPKEDWQGVPEGEAILAGSRPGRRGRRHALYTHPRQGLMAHLTLMDAASRSRPMADGKKSKWMKRGHPDGEEGKLQGDFALPGKKTRRQGFRLVPIPDASHARNAQP